MSSYPGRPGGDSRHEMSEIAMSAAIGAGLMLFFAWFRGIVTGVSDSPVYNFSVETFNWVLRIGGVLMGLAAVALWIGLRPALLVDAVLAAGIGVLMLVIGGIWLANQDYEGALLLFFGAMFVHSGRGSWLAHRGAGPRSAMRKEQDEAERAEPPVSADLVARDAAVGRLLAGKKREHPPASSAGPNPAPLPSDSAPPPEGFLAELGRDDSERK